MELHDLVGPSGFWRLRFCRGLGGELRRQGIDWNDPESRADLYGADPALGQLGHRVLSGQTSISSVTHPDLSELVETCERIFREEVENRVFLTDEPDVAEEELALTIPLLSGQRKIGTLDRLRTYRSVGVFADWKFYRDYSIPYELARWQSFVYAYGVFTVYVGVQKLYGLVVNPFGAQKLSISFERSDMDVMRSVISGAYDDFDRDDLEPTPGAHCHGCPALASCRAHQRALRVRTAYSSLGLERRTNGSLEVVDDEKLRRAWHAIKIARRRADQFEQWIKEALHQSSSTALALKRSSGRRNLAEEVERYTQLPGPVREHISEDEWVELTKRRPTLGELRQIYVKNRHPSTTVKDAKAEFDEDMEGSGLVERSADTYSVREI